jgi:exosortase A-associated hydrolase 1
MADRVLTLDCMGEESIAVLSEPETMHHTGIIVIPGGPQYRVGSHRQFVLLARRLARAGFAVLRFDPRGRGDGAGDALGFEHLTPDVGNAIDLLGRECPSVRQIVLWGLCDAASVALLYCRETADPRVNGVVLVNPWVRSDETLARTHLKHYYVKRLADREFWANILTRPVRIVTALSTFLRSLRNARGSDSTRDDGDLGFQARMAEALRDITHPVLIVLSGQDWTAKEFVEYWGPTTGWPGLLERPNIECAQLPDADHTCSTAAARNELETATIAWLKRSFRTI